MSTSCEHIRERLSARLDHLVDGGTGGSALAGEELARIEAHLAECDTCRAVADALAETRDWCVELGAVAAPAGFAASVGSAIRNTRQDPAPPRRFRGPGPILATMGLAAGVLAMAVLIQQTRPGDSYAPVAGKALETDKHATGVRGEDAKYADGVGGEAPGAEAEEAESTGDRKNRAGEALPLQDGPANKLAEEKAKLARAQQGLQNAAERKEAGDEQRKLDAGAELRGHAGAKPGTTGAPGGGLAAPGGRVNAAPRTEDGRAPSQDPSAPTSRDKSPAEAAPKDEAPEADADAPTEGGDAGMRRAARGGALEKHAEGLPAPRPAAPAEPEDSNDGGATERERAFGGRRYRGTVEDALKSKARTGERQDNADGADDAAVEELAKDRESAPERVMYVVARVAPDSVQARRLRAFLASNALPETTENTSADRRLQEQLDELQGERGRPARADDPMRGSEVEARLPLEVFERLENGGLLQSMGVGDVVAVQSAMQRNAEVLRRLGVAPNAAGFANPGPQSGASGTPTAPTAPSAPAPPAAGAKGGGVGGGSKGVTGGPTGPAGPTTTPTTPTGPMALGGPSGPSNQPTSPTAPGAPSGGPTSPTGPTSGPSGPSGPSLPNGPTAPGAPAPEPAKSQGGWGAPTKKAEQAQARVQQVVRVVLVFEPPTPDAKPDAEAAPDAGGK